MKTVLLIGGSSGIGYETAKLLRDNYKVIIASRNNPELDKVKHLKFDVLEDDISDLDLPDAIDGLVYCPGSIDLKPFKMTKPESFRKEMELNFFGLVDVVHGLLDKLKNAEKASLVFFSTVAVKRGMPFHTSVAASKGAVEGFARSLAAEYAPNFRVNVIAPSLTDTPLSEKLLNNDDKKEKMSERHPMKRVGKPGDIANFTKYLLDDSSGWVTGQVFGIDGGMSTLNVN